MRSRIDSGRPVALVTGASSGIGRAYAERLAADGYDLIVTARRAGRLKDLQQRLEAEHGCSVKPVVADLATEDGRNLVEAAAAHPRLEFLVANAGLAHYMPFTELAADRARELVNLNALAPMSLLHCALPAMVQRGHGTIIGVASQLVFATTSDNPDLPHRAAYSATKAFLFTLIRLVATELHGSGVTLQVVCPGAVRTEFHSRQGVDVSHLPRLDPAQVVQASLRGIELGEVVCLPSLDEPARLERHDEAELQVLAGGMRPQVADRYSQSICEPAVGAL
jgi:short-subunit dehydrogenase